MNGAATLTQLGGYNFAYQDPSPFSQKPLHVPFAVDDANNPNRFRVCVNDKIGVDRPEEDISVREVLALVAHARHFSEMTECEIKFLKQSVCGVEIVRGDEFPDVLKVPDGAPGQVESLHARCRRRSAL